MAIQKSIGKWKFWSPVELQPLKISFWNLAHIWDMTHVQILEQISSEGGSPQIREI